MEINFKVIPARELSDGDIFYCTPDPELNEFGIDAALTGTDQILIRDDYYDEDDDGNYGILVNGGRSVWFRPNEKVVVLAHYGELLRIIDMVKEGHPDMQLGENDINGMLHDFYEVHPELQPDLLAGLDLPEHLLRGSDDEQNEDDAEEDIDEDELPF